MIQNKQLNSNDFCAELEALHLAGRSYLDGCVELMEKYNIDEQQAAKLLSHTMAQKIKSDAQNLNMIEKSVSVFD